jgi:hypothetical protein
MEIIKGLNIVKSMLDIGLLLTPDFVDWGKFLVPNKLELHRIFQKRICFTFLPSIELLEHAKEYGGFALEFDDKNIRLLGALPLFYVPPVTTAEITKQFPSHILVNRLLETLVFLKSIRINNSELREKLENSLNGVRGLFGLLYPTEQQLDAPLKNYLLREWRITGNTIQHYAKLHNLNTELNPDEKEKLMKIENEFFASEIEFQGRMFNKADQCMKYPKLFGKHILSYARRLIVPDKAAYEAKKIIEEGMDKPRLKVFSKSEFIASSN